MNVLETFPAFVVNGWGLYTARAPLTVKSINQTIPALLELADYSHNKSLEIKPVCDFSIRSGISENQDNLKSLFNRYGSDKATKHDYYLAYCQIIGNPEQVSKVFEIGIGTNNIDVVSTMGIHGKPGASLRAFRDYCPEARIFGADVDKRVLFTEDRIQTFFVDQTDVDTFETLGKSIGDNFDLMIDDGLHAPNANLHSLNFFLPRIRVGGWAVIEDISPNSIPIWQLVCTILPVYFECHLIQAKSSSCMFLAKRLK